jgi:hypothetical protein
MQVAAQLWRDPAICATQKKVQRKNIASFLEFVVTFFCWILPDL